MGQYYLIVNTDREEYLHPHDAAHGLKALEIASGQLNSVVQYLCTQTDGGGGGDFRDTGDLFGTWAGDSLTWIGDYDSSELFNTAEEEFTNITEAAVDEYNRAVPISMMFTPYPWSGSELKSMTEREKKAFTDQWAEWFIAQYGDDADAHFDPEEVSPDEFVRICRDYFGKDPSEEVSELFEE